MFSVDQNNYIITGMFLLYTDVLLWYQLFQINIPVAHKKK